MSVQQQEIRSTGRDQEETSAKQTDPRGAFQKHFTQSSHSHKHAEPESLKQHFNNTFHK